jgi:hypothetical protein
MGNLNSKVLNGGKKSAPKKAEAKKPAAPKKKEG